VIAYIASCAVLFALVFGRTTKASLALHRDGIRFRRRTYRFDDLLAIRDGRARRGIEVIAMTPIRWLGKFHPSYRHAVESAKIVDAASLTLVLKDGRSCPLVGVGFLCEPQDYGHFLELIRLGHSRLFEGS
ncbi:MAG TPA: hypothetical protein VGH33_01655, partial [Isosphaeraceae bacterium]